MAIFTRDKNPLATRRVGPVTGATTAGGGLGVALSQILVHLVPSLAPVETAVTMVVTIGLALISGWLVPPKVQEYVDSVVEDAFGDDFAADYVPGDHAEESPEELEEGGVVEVPIADGIPAEEEARDHQGA